MWYKIVTCVIQTKVKRTSKNKKFSNRFPVVKYMSLRKLFKKLL